MKAFCKPFLFVALALCLIFALIACGGKEDEATDAFGNDAVSTADAEEVSSDTKDDATSVENTAPKLQEGGALAESGWSGMATDFDTSPT